MLIDQKEIERRWFSAWEAKQDELRRLEASYSWLYEFEQHLLNGEEGDRAYRFPELFGYGIRRFNNIVQVLPECKVRGNSDSSIGLQAAIDHHKNISNIDREKVRALYDAAFVGTSCLCCVPCTFAKTIRRGGKEEKEIRYRGLAAERVDWRLMFPAPGAIQLHDQTGQVSCPWLFRKKIYHEVTFKQLYGNNPKYKNINKVEPTSFDASSFWGDKTTLTSHEQVEISTGLNYVTVLQYWDITNDILREYANGIEIYDSPDGIGYEHRDYPFHIYYNYKRADSINGIGEIELNMPYNLFREKLLNLMEMNVSLSVQQAWIVDGHVNWNVEEQEVRPGAVLEMDALTPGDNVRNHIMPYNAGGTIGNDVYNFLREIENSRIGVTSDNTTDLFSNSQQLATEIKAKRETFNKSIDATTKRNTIDTEYYLVKQIASYIQHELSKPYKKTDKSKPSYIKIKIEGYYAKQDTEEADVEFVQAYGAESEFAQNAKVTELYDETEIEFVDKQQDAVFKIEKLNKLTQIFEIIMKSVVEVMQVNPDAIGSLFKNMEFSEFVKLIIQEADVTDDLQKVFPVIAKEKLQLDTIALENDQIMGGIVPTIDPEQNSSERLNKLFEFGSSSFFKEHANKKAKEAYKKYIILLLQNAREQLIKPIKDRQRELESTQGNVLQQGVSGNNAVVQGAPTAGGTTPNQGGAMQSPVQSRQAPAGAV